MPPVPSAVRSSRRRQRGGAALAAREAELKRTRTAAAATIRTAAALPRHNKPARDPARIIALMLSPLTRQRAADAVPRRRRRRPRRPRCGHCDVLRHKTADCPVLPIVLALPNSEHPSSLSGRQLCGCCNTFGHRTERCPENSVADWSSDPDSESSSEQLELLTRHEHRRTTPARPGSRVVFARKLEARDIDNGASLLDLADPPERSGRLRSPPAAKPGSLPVVRPIVPSSPDYSDCQGAGWSLVPATPDASKPPPSRPQPRRRNPTRRRRKPRAKPLPEINAWDPLRLQQALPPPDTNFRASAPRDPFATPPSGAKSRAQVARGAASARGRGRGRGRGYVWRRRAVAQATRGDTIAQATHSAAARQPHPVRTPTPQEMGFDIPLRDGFPKSLAHLLVKSPEPATSPPKSPLISEFALTDSDIVEIQADLSDCS